MFEDISCTYPLNDKQHLVILGQPTTSRCPSRQCGAVPACGTCALTPMRMETWRPCSARYVNCIVPPPSNLNHLPFSLAKAPAFVSQSRSFEFSNPSAYCRSHSLHHRIRVSIWIFAHHRSGRRRPIRPPSHVHFALWVIKLYILCISLVNRTIPDPTCRSHPLSYGSFSQCALVTFTPTVNHSPPISLIRKVQPLQSAGSLCYHMLISSLVPRLPLRLYHAIAPITVALCSEGPYRPLRSSAASCGPPREHCSQFTLVTLTIFPTLLLRVFSG